MIGDFSSTSVSQASPSLTDDFLVFCDDGIRGFVLKLHDKTCCEKEECSPPNVDKVELESESEDSDPDSDDVKPAENASLTINRKRKPDARESIKPGKCSAIISVNVMFKELLINILLSWPYHYVFFVELCCKVRNGAKPGENEKAMEAACSFKLPNPHLHHDLRESAHRIHGLWI